MKRYFALLTLIGSAVFPTQSSADTPVSQEKAPAISKIQDMQLETADGTFNLLIHFEHQPYWAASHITEDGIRVLLKGVALKSDQLLPPTKPYIEHVSIAPNSQMGSDIHLKTTSLTDLRTQLYRNSVLVTGKMKNYVAPLQKSTKTTKIMSIAAHFNLDDTSCTNVDAAMKADPWDMTSMGDHILCLLADEQIDKASRLLEQLESFSPDNWKAHLARGQLHKIDGKHKEALSEFSYAMKLAEQQATKAQILEWAARK